ncbi:hypothetical protein THAOC_23644 [Thalassiosira oceanica]|uniref:Uncharacterized protein n=1 Tax=Thalassiosira oceanica TaxID=159749 RepID=K0RRL0_THAOC|nr:hypothetical protein THAOC_23644 [Thalassiosira oceanica]|eukprot:EJK56463.1 hypothetical protein THAOC_23644 [Thalassiosira oceanica]
MANVFRAECRKSTLSARETSSGRGILSETRECGPEGRATTNLLPKLQWEGDAVDPRPPCCGPSASSGPLHRPRASLFPRIWRYILRGGVFTDGVGSPGRGGQRTGDRPRRPAAGVLDTTRGLLPRLALADALPAVGGRSGPVPWSRRRRNDRVQPRVQRQEEGGPRSSLAPVDERRPPPRAEDCRRPCRPSVPVGPRMSVPRAGRSRTSDSDSRPILPGGGSRWRGMRRERVRMGGTDRGRRSTLPSVFPRGVGSPGGSRARQRELRTLPPSATPPVNRGRLQSSRRGSREATLSSNSSSSTDSGVGGGQCPGMDRERRSFSGAGHGNDGGNAYAAGSQGGLEVILSKLCYGHE